MPRGKNNSAPIRATSEASMVSIMFRLFGLFFAFIPCVAIAYSDEYCVSLINATSDALNARDWRRVLEVTTDRERNCARYITVNELAGSINDRANAYLELGKPQEALNAASQCIRIAKIPECHITKGDILLSLSRSREGTEEIRLGKKLVDQEISRLRVELQRASSVSEGQRLESELNRYKALAGLADTLLNVKPPLPSRAEVKRESPTSGSGILLNSTGDVLTNYHVVEGCKTLSAFDSAKKRSAATVVAIDPPTDLAVVRIRSSVGEPAVFRSGASPQVGETVAAIGFPLTGLLASGANVSFGHIGALAGLGDDDTKLQISAPVQPGNSGGPLLDQGGLVIGVVVQKLDAIKVAKLTGDIPQNINFAIKGSVAQKFLASRGVTFSAAVPSGVLEGIEVAKRGKVAAVLIKCER